MDAESEIIQQYEVRNKSRLRVLRISHSATVDAYRERDRQLASREDIELELIAPKYWDHLGGKNEAINESFPVHRAATYKTGSVPLFAFDPQVIEDALVKFKPDVVDVHEEPYSVSGFESIWLARRHAPAAACVFYSAQNILKRYPPPFCWTEQYVFKSSSGAYPCSDGVKTVLQTKGFNFNSDVIPLGVDLSLYSPYGPAKRAEYGLSSGDYVIGYFGRIESYKGVQHLIEALARSPETGSWRLLLVGSGSYEEELKRLATKLGVSEQLVWTGPVDGGEVPAFMRSCDVIAVPSLTTKTWREQFGRIVVESMACGVPVVSFDSGSLPEVVGDTGLLAKEGNTGELHDALQRLAKDLTLRKSLGDKGLLRAQREYTWGRVAEQMRLMYERAVDSHSKKRR
ncbi:MAG: glycosyltransferase family 4 protein [Cyanobacteria bacterium SZAS-4]|nr:glycosyltransferase family 4 protein [Cyanobacteria bacterium SZAS-4]